MALKYNEITGEFENVEDSSSTNLSSLLEDLQYLIQYNSIKIGVTTIEDLKARNLEVRWELGKYYTKVDNLSIWADDETGVVESICWNKENCYAPYEWVTWHFGESKSINEWNAFFEGKGLIRTEMVDACCSRMNGHQIFRAVNSYAVPRSSIALEIDFRVNAYVDIQQPETIKGIPINCFNVRVMTDLKLGLVLPTNEPEPPLRYLKFNENGDTVVGCDKDAEGTIVIPKGVKIIGDNAFKDCIKITEVILPDGIRELKSSSFNNCRELQKINLPDSIEVLGDKVFYNCWKLGNVIMPKYIKEIGHYSFYWCICLNSIIVPDSVTRIGAFAFYGCRNLQSVTIGNSLKTIGSYPFGYCSSLTEIKVNSANLHFTSLKNILYDKCMESVVSCPEGIVGQVIIADGVKRINSSAFNGCTKLTEIIIPESVTSIGSFAFQNCTALKNVLLSKNVISYGTCNYPKVCIDKLNPYLTSTEEGMVCSKSKKELLSISQQLENTILTVPESVETISDFIYRSFKCVKLGSSIKRLSRYNFSNCKIKELHIAVENPNSIAIEEGTFKDFNRAACILYVPGKSVSAYKENPYFVLFKEINAIPGTEVATMIDATLKNLVLSAFGVMDSSAIFDKHLLVDEYERRGWNYVWTDDSFLLDDVPLNLMGMKLKKAMVAPAQYTNKIKVNYYFELNKGNEEKTASEIIARLMEEARLIDGKCWKVLNKGKQERSCGGCFKTTVFKIIVTEINSKYDISIEIK